MDAFINGSPVAYLGRVNWGIIGSSKHLPPVQQHAIAWNNDLLSAGPYCI